MELVKFEKGKLTVTKFLSHVYSWLCESRNRFVEDFHYSLANCANAESLEELTKDEEVRSSIKMFLEQRMIQGEGILLSTVPSWFLSKATTKYIYNMYN